MITGKYFISTGYKEYEGNLWHILFALHKEFKIAFVKPESKPNYRRIYIGWLEIEYSFNDLNSIKGYTK